MRIVLFTGKGGVGKTTTAAATALRLADRGVKTLLLSTDIAHSLSDALAVQLSDEPAEVAPGLWAVQVDTQGRFEAAWRDVQAFLIDMLFESLLRLNEELASVRQLLGDPKVTSVRLVLTPESVVAAEARRTFTALALYGYSVDLVVANRVFAGGDDAWRQGWAAAQQK